MSTHTDNIEQQLQLEASYWVYYDGLDMDYEDIEKLLSEPRDKIIHDMELLIRDAIDNHAVYEKLMTSFDTVEFIDPDFLIMALLVLGEVESEGSLPLLLEVLKQNSDWNNFWFEDENLDLLWEPGIHIGKNHLDQIEQFIKDPNTPNLARDIVGDTLVQQALHYPSFRQEIIEIITRQIKQYIEQRNSQSTRDRDHMGTIVWDLADLGDTENLPLIKQVFDLKLMELDVLGDFNETERIFSEMKETNSARIMKKLMPLTDRHAWYWDKINEETQHMYWDDDEDDDFDEDFPDDFNEEGNPFSDQIISPWDDTELEPIRLEETNFLYIYGIDIEPELIKKILGAPRKQLIQDLEIVLKDAAKNHASLVENIEKSSAEIPSEFVIHALFFLAELKATESLPLVLKILKMNDSWLEYWLGDILTDAVWEVIYKLGRNRLDLLLDFMKDRETDTYCRSVISDAVEQIAWHEPERKVDVVDWFKAVLQYQKSWTPDDEGFSPDFNGLFVDSILNLKAVELLPDIKDLFEMEYVNPGIAGAYEVIESLIKEPNLVDPKRKILSIEQRYEELIHIFPNDIFDADKRFEDEIKGQNYSHDKHIQQSVVKSEKIGRNDPCPCGSGLKYKKCCMEK